MTKHYHFGRSVTLGAALAFGLMFATSVASAQVTPNPATLNVSLNLLAPDPVCSATIAPLVFPDRDAGSVAGATIATFDISLTCDKSGTSTLTFDGGNNPAGTSRRMAHASGGLVFYFLEDPALQSIPNDGSVAIAVINGTVVETFGGFINVATVFPSTPGPLSDVVSVTFSF